MTVVPVVCRPIDLPIDPGCVVGVAVSVGAAAGVAVADAVGVKRGMRVGRGVRVGPNVGKGRWVAVGPIGRGVGVDAAQPVSSNIRINRPEMNRIGLRP